MPRFDYQADLASMVGSLVADRADAGPIHRLHTAVESTANYDFATHEFLFDPVRGYDFPLSDVGLAWLQADPYVPSVGHFRDMATLLGRVERAIRDEVGRGARPGWDTAAVTAAWIVDLYQPHANHPSSWSSAADLVTVGILANQNVQWIARVYELVVPAIIVLRIYRDYPSYRRTWLDTLPGYVMGSVGGPFDRLLQLHAAELAAVRTEVDTRSRTGLPYDVAAAGSVNLGLRLIYRQEWHPLGVQPGEIVKTIPLGPGESHKVSVQIKRRTKSTRTLGTKEESESASEGSATTKDSSELVNEAIAGERWNLTKDANIEIEVPFVKADGGLAEFDESTVQNTTRATAIRLSEVMQKTSSRVRRESTVTVSTESEASFELQRSSEIANANAEIAVTYEYMTLQRYYEVFTRLAEVIPVVYVAERLTDPELIDVDWIRRHDWILAKVLRDESFRPTLSLILQEDDPIEEMPGEDRHGQIYDAAIGSFAQFAPVAGVAGGGLTIPDIYGTPQRTFAGHMRELRQRRQEKRRRDLLVERFKRHLRDNLLVYHQLIWAAEPGEQRLLRYRKENRRVPVAWRGTLAGASTVSAAGAQFAPSGEEAALAELIDPAGPLGYVANYAVFALRVSPRFSAAPTEIAPDAQGVSTLRLNDLMSIVRGPYVSATGALQDPALAFERTRTQDPAFDWPALRMLSDPEVVDFVSYLPWLVNALLDDTGRVLRDADGGTTHRIGREDWAYYLYRKNATTRFLVDTNNLYLNIFASSGAALEPFKRAHRYLDVLKAAEEVESQRQKNLRREALIGDPATFDPDIQKVVVVGAGAAVAPVAIDPPIV